MNIEEYPVRCEEHCIRGKFIQLSSRIESRRDRNKCSALSGRVSDGGSVMGELFDLSIRPSDMIDYTHRGGWNLRVVFSLRDRSLSCF